MCVCVWGGGVIGHQIFCFCHLSVVGCSKNENTCMMRLGAEGRKILVTKIKMYPTPPDKNEYS